jgi:streptomycin 3"-adenylyltransferase
VAQFGWDDCPADVRGEAAELATALADVLGNDLVGAYVHGSLAFGCFNPTLSDLDVVAVERRHAPLERKRAVVAELGRLSGAPVPIEFHLLAELDLRPWRYPVAFDLHFGGDWGADLLRDLEATLARQPQGDRDLAAHLVVLRERGIALAGPSPAAALPPVPYEDYVDALLHDLRWALELDRAPAVYKTLSPLRVWATLATGDLHSKDSAAVWALERLPPDLRPLVERALARYRGEADDSRHDENEYRRFAAFVRERVAEIARAGEAGPG